MSKLTNHAHAHSEIIVCPNCNATQKACVLHSAPWWTYIHECTECHYVIMESEWQSLQPAKVRICDVDKNPCDQHITGVNDCVRCDRSYHGVKATGAMPALEQFFKWISKKLKR